MNGRKATLHRVSLHPIFNLGMYIYTYTDTSSTILSQIVNFKGLSQLYVYMYNHSTIYVIM